MNFFAMDEEKSRMVGTSMIWIFVVSTFFLTALTFLFYYWLLQHDGVLFQRLAPKVPLSTNIKTLARKLTKTNMGLEQERPSV